MASAGNWTLGDLTVNRMGFGAMRITGRGPFGRGASSDRGQAIAVLRRALELGINHIDTAAFYFTPLRSANELINTALSPYPDELVIVSKVGPSRDPSGKWMPWATPEQLRGQVEDNLRQLGRDHLDVVNLRVTADGPIGEHFAALAELREAGLVRHLGVSTVGREQLAEAEAIAPVVCVQNRYGLDTHTPADDAFVRECGERGIAFVPYFAIAGEAAASGDAPAEHTGVLAIAEAHHATPAQIRLAWSLHQGPHVLAIPGTGSLDHLEENVATGELQLTDDELTQLDSIRLA